MKTNQSAPNRSPEQLKSKIQKREARVGIIGLGYVGLPLALLYSEQKFQVTGFDIDQRKVVVRTFNHLHPNGQGKLLLSFSPKVNYAEVRAIEVIDEGQYGTER